jgi:hypothetical protein
MSCQYGLLRGNKFEAEPHSYKSLTIVNIIIFYIQKIPLPRSWDWHGICISAGIGPKDAGDANLRIGQGRVTGQAVLPRRRRTRTPLTLGDLMQPGQDLFRPCRAAFGVDPISQGFTPGFAVSPRWGRIS